MNLQDRDREKKNDKLESFKGISITLTINPQKTRVFIRFILTVESSTRTRLLVIKKRKKKGKGKNLLTNT